MVDIYSKDRIAEIVSEIKSRKQSKPKRCSLKAGISSKDQFAKRLKRFVSLYKLDIMSENRYNFLREGLSDYPCSKTYRKVFGSWREACIYTFGKCNGTVEFERKEKVVLPESFRKEIDDSYFVRLMIEYKIRNYGQYDKLRNKCPDVFPPLSIIVKRFGSWNNLKLASLSLSVDEEIKKLVDMKMATRRKIPPPKKLKELGVNIRLLMDRFGGYRKLMRIVSEMLVSIEIKERNKRKNIPVDGKIPEREKKEVFDKKFE